jgi:hypothetical protein
VAQAAMQQVSSLSVAYKLAILHKSDLQIEALSEWS